MRHPIEKYNQQQAAMLAELPESQQEYMARMFRIGNATYCYYQRAKELALFTQAADTNPEGTINTVEAFVVWLQQQIEQANSSGEGNHLAT